MPIMPRLIAMILGAAFAALTLAGCTSEDGASSFLVAPGKYVLYQCEDIDRTAKSAVARQKELEQLMAKASTSPTGQLIGDAAYGTELATLRGQLRDLREAARDKHCNFTPGAEPPAAPVPAATVR